jgi:carboxypeptidase Taq
MEAFAMSWTELDTRCREINDLDRISSLLSWDEETYLPKQGHGARGRQAGTLESIRHQRMTDPRLGELLESLAFDKSLDPARLVVVRRMKRRRDLAVRLPERLVRALAEARSKSLEAWHEAKPKGDFQRLAPAFEELVSLVREKGAALATGGGDPYDALMDEHEPAMTSTRLRPLFQRLREALVPLVQKISEKPAPATAIFEQPFDLAKQWELTVRVLKELRFDLERGRQDKSAHPFCETIGENDVRVTTRFFEKDVLNAFYSTIHECGHALYEQGFDPAHHGSELARAPSMGIHESQSRLWENQIGRSHAFWQKWIDIFREMFPAQLAGIGVKDVHKAVNKVKPGMIRVDADELTYNLHVLLRFEIESALVHGELSVRDLPGVWNERMNRYLGLTPKNDTEGCMQDIHWPSGAFGYFPSYTIGNAYAAQLMKRYESEHPAVWDDVARGDHAPLLSWLREKVHRRGHLMTAEETIEAATGSGLDPEPLIAYLQKKYGELYNL